MTALAFAPGYGELAEKLAAAALPVDAKARGGENGIFVPTGHPAPNYILPARERSRHEKVPVVGASLSSPCSSRRSPLPQARADVTLPKVIGSHMVLQRDRPLPIWGWADPGEEVTVKLDEATATAKADAQGNWKVVLPAVKADGKAHRMTVSGKNKIELGRHPHRRGVDRLRASRTWSLA